MSMPAPLNPPPDAGRADGEPLEAEPDYRQRIARRLAEHYEALYGRPPRWRYFQQGNGPMFCWTTERAPSGRFESFVYRPVGPGARTGKATTWEITDSQTRRHAKRKAAKARALTLYQAWKSDQAAKIDRPNPAAQEAP